MNPNELQSVLKAAFEAAPKELREYVVSGSFEKAMKELQAEILLSPESEQVVNDEVLLLLLGMSEPIEFVAALEEQANLSESQMERVIAYVNEQIFGKIEGKGDEAVSVPILEASAPSAPSPTPTPAVPAVPEAPHVRTMAHDVESMKAGKPAAMFPTRPLEEIPSAKATPKPPQAERATPLARLETPQTKAALPEITRAVPPVPNTPTQMPSSFSNAPSAEEVRNDLKQYGVDPYREPIE